MLHRQIKEKILHYPLSMLTFHTISGLTKSHEAGSTSATLPASTLSPALQKVADSFDAILSEIQEGSSLVKAIKKRKIFAMHFYEWLQTPTPENTSGTNIERYTRAREMRRDLRFEEITEIARKAQPENAHVARLQIDTVKWQLSKEDPSKYGDKPLTINNSTVNNTLIIGDAALEELQAARKSLLESASMPTREA